MVYTLYYEYIFTKCQDSPSFFSKHWALLMLAASAFKQDLRILKAKNGKKKTDSINELRHVSPYLQLAQHISRPILVHKLSSCFEGNQLLVHNKLADMLDL